jgi:hypothetical protein
MAYVRVAVGSAGGDRLREEADRYAATPHYAAHFARMGVAAIDTAVLGADHADVQRRLSAWDGAVDEVVVRVVPASDTEADVQAVLEAAAPR